jgi:hypothetical protein
MSPREDRRGFAARPGDAESWVKAAALTPASRANADGFTARLTIDVTPALRGRIKIEAFRRGQTVADMLRDLLARTFPDPDGGTP